MERTPLSEEQIIITDALATLGATKSKEAIPFLLSLLTKKEAYIRNEAALALAEIRDPVAVGPLVEAIKNHHFKNERGSLVYALGHFDCAEYFLLLVDLALSGNYEVQNHALEILKNQNFSFTSENVQAAHEAIEKYKSASHQGEDLQLMIKELTEYIAKAGKNMA